MLMSKLSNTISHENYSYLPPYLFLFIWELLFILIVALAKLWQREGQSLRMWPVAFLCYLRQGGQGAQALQNTDLDKEERREGLPLLEGDGEKSKAFQDAAPSPGTSYSPLQLGRCWVDNATGEGKLEVQTSPLPLWQLMMGSLAGTRPKLLHPRVSGHGEALAEGAAFFLPVLRQPRVWIVHSLNICFFTPFFKKSFHFQLWCSLLRILELTKMWLCADDKKPPTSTVLIDRLQEE